MRKVFSKYARTRPIESLPIKSLPIKSLPVRFPRPVPGSASYIPKNLGINPNVGLQFLYFRRLLADNGERIGQSLGYLHASLLFGIERKRKLLTRYRHIGMEVTVT
jgi:hypothetical protein